MAIGQQIIPQEGMALDISENYLKETMATFIKNLTSKVNDKEGAALDEGSNEFDFTPLESVLPYGNLVLPSGNNYPIGGYYSDDIEQAYVFVYNSQKNHFIYRINGKTGVVEYVLKTACLNFQLDPRYFISEGRCMVKTARYFNKKTVQEDLRIFLIFTDNVNDVRHISVEDCIATNFFDPNQFAFFAVNDPNCYRCNLINLGLPTPAGCIGLTPIGRDLTDPTEATKINKLMGNTWQFRIRGQDVWGRDTEHGDISTMYIPAIGSSCMAGNTSQPRCLKLKFSAQCPTIERLYIEFRNWSGNTPGLSTETDWYQAAVLEKYDNTDTNKLWWERPINGDGTFVYNTSDNTIEYTFCASTEKVPLDFNETNRNENPLALTASTVFPIGDRLGLGRPRHGFEPMDPKELAKVKFTVTPPTADTTCQPKGVKVDVYAIIWNPFEGTAQQIRKDDQGNIMFGVATCSKNNPYAYDQVFPSGQEGFVGSLRGTKNYVLSKQVRYDTLTGKIDEVGLDYTQGGIVDFGRYRPLQRFTFENVLPGTYIFQVASHKSTPQDEFMKTSTYTIGTTDINNVGNLLVECYELRLNACSGDLSTLTTPLMIYDLTRIGKGCAVVDATSVNAGYLYEDEKNGIPIERALIEPNVGSAVRPTWTDHNGFYWAATRERGLRTDLYGTKNGVGHQFLISSRASLDNVANWYKFDKLYLHKVDELYPSSDHSTLKGRVVQCDNNAVGIPGALVIVKNGGWTVTHSDGTFQVIVHDNGDGTLRLNESVIFSQQGACHLIACIGTCNACLPDQIFSTVAPSSSDRVINLSLQGALINGANKRGPKMGSRIGAGLVLRDWMKRETYVQANSTHYLDIPTLADTGLFDFSKIGFDLTGVKFPAWVTDVSFYFTANLNYEDWLVWVAERVQYIDNTGNTNTAAPTQVRLYYESLGAYNVVNGLSTNTTWQFLTNTKTTVLGDVIEVLANGDGSIYRKRITAQVKHDVAGKYIQVDYDDSLAGLLDGCLIQLTRPKVFQQDNFYYSACPVIRVANSVATVLTGFVDYFDSYLQTRQIPVPVQTKTKDSDGAIVTTTENQLRNFPFFFEHHSPSDFWGDHAWNKGRVNVKNPNEHQRTKLLQIDVSKVFSDSSVINALHYFDDADSKDYDMQDKGGIVVCIADDNTILVICEKGTYTILYNDPNVFVSDGRVVAPSVDQSLGRPRPKVGDNFGCSMEDINTIRRRRGKVVFLDRSKNALVVHDFNRGFDVTEDPKTNTPLMRSWLTSKIAFIKNFNLGQNGVKYFHGVIDPMTNEYLLTDSLIEAAASVVVQACAPGYTLSADGTVCSKIDQVPPISQQAPIHAATSQNENYSDFGTKIYDPGFTLDGEGSATQIPSTNHFWINFDASLVNGPMNRNGVWVDNNNDGIVDPLVAGNKLAITTNIVSTTRKTYYFGLGGDNKATLTVNGVVIVDKQNIVDDQNFKWWHIYPVQLEAGNNLISITGEGDGSIQDCIALEVYENTFSQILAAQSYLDLNVRFRTADTRGGILQITTCPDGYQPINVGGAWVCQKVLTSPAQPVNVDYAIPDTKYINNLGDPNVSVSETILYDLSAFKWNGFRSFVPEYYVTLEGDKSGAQLISLRKGAPWKHHQLNNPGSTFLSVYGTPVDVYLEVVFNLQHSKEKNFLWNEVYCREVLLYADRIVTSSGQQSRLMPLWWDRRDKFWCADFKCAVNTPPDTMLPVQTGANALLDGDELYGTWLKARYRLKVADRNSGKYFQLLSIIGFMNGAEKSGVK